MHSLVTVQAVDSAKNQLVQSNSSIKTANSNVILSGTARCVSCDRHHLLRIPHSCTPNPSLLVTDGCQLDTFTSVQGCLLIGSSCNDKLSLGEVRQAARVEVKQFVLANLTT